MKNEKGKEAMKKGYFAHSRSDYGMQVEKKMLTLIKQHFKDCEMINPGAPAFRRWVEPQVDKFQSANEYITPFLKVINGCDFLVFMPLETGKTGVGTFLEVRHAEASQIPVYVWNGEDFTTEYRLDECHNRGGKLDYKDNWSLLTLGKSYRKGEVQLNIKKAEVHVKQNERRTEVRHNRWKEVNG